MRKAHYACGSGDHMMSRRNFLGGLSGGAGLGMGLGMGMGLGSLVNPVMARDLEKRAKQVVMIWMAGGLSQLESWDPKPNTDTGGPFRSIETSVPGIRISELLPKTARLTHHMALVRGLNTNENDHGKGHYLMHTGRPEIPGANHPHLGALVAKLVSEETNPLPGHIHIASGGGGANSSEATFLGPKYGSLMLGNGNPPANMDRDSKINDAHDQSREKLRKHWNERFLKSRRSAITDAYISSYDQARQLMTRKEVFDVTKESARDQERYGSHDFGRHCLLGRRLIESGVTFVKITHSNYDTHNENFDFHLEQLGEFDQGFACLLGDLADRGRLDNTLVIVMSEFGRTPNINHLYGRDHWGTAWSVALAGCGLKRGLTFGETNPRGTAVAKDEVSGADMFHTYLQALGVPSKEPVEINGRDVQITDPRGNAIKGVLA